MTASAYRPPPPALVKPDAVGDVGSVPGLNEPRPPNHQHPHLAPGNVDAGRREQNRNHAGRNQDLVDNLFLNSEKPTIALFAISICLVGVMDLLPRERHDPDMWKDKLELVSGFYGPGAVISWCLSGVSMLYDANQASRTSPQAFHYVKYGSVIVTGTFAVGDAVKRALYSDFGPSYAAALYMSDKAFELATLLYTVYHFPVHRENAVRRAAVHQHEPEAERPANYLRAQAAAAVKRYERYKIWPCVAMVSIWVWSRALGNQHAVYNIHAQNPTGWNSVLPSPYWKLLVPVICGISTSTVSFVTGWGFWAWGLPMGILSSFAALHSGFFGTFTPLKLTACSIFDWDQATCLIMTSLILTVQYLSQVSVIRERGKKTLQWALDLLGKRREDGEAHQ